MTKEKMFGIAGERPQAARQQPFRVTHCP